MTRPLSRFAATLLGALLLVSALLAGYGLFRIGDRQQLWHGTATLQAAFADLGGVGPGTSVRVRGVEAGSVQAVELPPASDPAGPIRVRLRIDRRFLALLHADACAVTHAEGMIGGKVVEIEPGQTGSLADGAEISTRKAPDLNALVTQARETLAELRDSQGTLGKLMRDPKAYDDLVGTLAQAKGVLADGQEAVRSIRRDADAVQKLPIVRSYASADAVDLLVRPRMVKHRQVMAANDLFEPGRAVLTESGKTRLEEVGTFLSEHREAGSELVIVVYAGPSPLSNKVAERLTREQAEAVAGQLRDKHAAGKLGRWPWQTRPVQVLGRGSQEPPEPETESLPAARVEVIVFVPA